MIRRFVRWLFSDHSSSGSGSRTSSPEAKGTVGEDDLCAQLRTFSKSGGVVLRNLHVPTFNKNTTEIDVVMVHPAGVFVFENKNYAGWIFADTKSQRWMQTLYSRRQKRAIKTPFYNPVFQNRTHVRAITRYLEDYTPVFSIIVFSDECEFKKLNNHSDAWIIHTREVKNVVQNIINENGPYFSEENISWIHSRLERCQEIIVDSS